MKMSLTKRRKLAISALAGTAGAAALFAFSAQGGGMEFNPERDLAAYDASLRSGRLLANTVENYDTDQTTVTIPEFYNNVANVWDSGNSRANEARTPVTTCAVGTARGAV